MNPEVFNQFKKATGLTIMEGFGQTETTLSIANFVGSTPKIGSMGRPRPLYDVVILDPDGNESTIEQAIYYFNNERPVRKLKGKPPVLYRTELVA